MLQIVTIISGILTVVLILLQQRGASLGSGSGSSGELFIARRGAEKALFEITVVLAVVFVLSILASVIIPAGV